MICPEIPDSGELADAYQQLLYFKQAGVPLILHCFTEKISQSAIDAVVPLVSDLQLYKRNQGHKGVSMRHPYCISSRSNPALLNYLKKQPGPVLFEGISTTFSLPDILKLGRKAFVRMNGIRSMQVASSMKFETSLVKKVYAFNELRMIRKWEAHIASQAVILPTTQTDEEKLKSLYPKATIRFIPPLMSQPQINCKTGTGMYCLYFGNLSQPENRRMANWLSEHIFSTTGVPFIVANTCNLSKPKEKLDVETNICTFGGTNSQALAELISKAQIVILPGCHSNGFDYRLMTALEHGRHCVCNDRIIDGTGLQPFFVRANDNTEMIEVLEAYFSRPFTEDDRNQRAADLSAHCSKVFASPAMLELIDA